MIRYTKGVRVKLTPFFIAGSVVFTAVVVAEVPVVEIEDRANAVSVRASPTTASVNPSRPNIAPLSAPMNAGSRQNQLSEIFTQMQQLRQEVQEMRGLVEQQSFEIQALKQQNKDNYVDLDGRISALQSSGVSASSGKDSISSSVNTSSASSLSSGYAGAEKDSYDAAIKLINEAVKDNAIAAFHQHIKIYPDGEYTPNAYYWLGQIYFTQGQNDAAVIEFSHLLKYYPDHRKTADAKFKMGQLYLKQGKKLEAKKLIQEVAAGNVDESKLAQTFLKDNF